MRKRVEQLPLVFVDALDLAIEDGVRIDDLPGRGFEPLGELQLGLALGLAEARRGSRDRRPAA